MRGIDWGRVTGIVRRRLNSPTKMSCYETAPPATIDELFRSSPRAHLRGDGCVDIAALTPYA